MSSLQASSPFGGVARSHARAARKRRLSARGFPYPPHLAARFAGHSKWRACSQARRWTVYCWCSWYWHQTHEITKVKIGSLNMNSQRILNSKLKLRVEREGTEQSSSSFSMARWKNSFTYIWTMKFMGQSFFFVTSNMKQTSRGWNTFHPFLGILLISGTSWNKKAYYP